MPEKEAAGPGDGGAVRIEGGTTTVESASIAIGAGKGGKSAEDVEDAGLIISGGSAQFVGEYPQAGYDASPDAHEKVYPVALRMLASTNDVAQTLSGVPEGTSSWYTGADSTLFTRSLIHDAAPSVSPAPFGSDGWLVLWLPEGPAKVALAQHAPYPYRANVTSIPKATTVNAHAKMTPTVNGNTGFTFVPGDAAGASSSYTLRLSDVAVVQPQPKPATDISLAYLYQDRVHAAGTNLTGLLATSPVSLRAFATAENDWYISELVDAADSSFNVPALPDAQTIVGDAAKLKTGDTLKASTTWLVDGALAEMSNVDRFRLERLVDGVWKKQGAWTAEQSGKVPASGVYRVVAINAADRLEIPSASFTIANDSAEPGITPETPGGSSKVPSGSASSGVGPEWNGTLPFTGTLFGKTIILLAALLIGLGSALVIRRRSRQRSEFPNC